MLRVTALQLPASWGDPAARLAAVDAELQRGPPTDLVLLPEASLTGYVSPDGEYDLGRFAEPIDGPTARAIGDVARRRGINLVAPLVLAEGAALFNAMVAFDRRGELMFAYRKRHPWDPETWATPGAEPAPTASIDGARVTIAICFDVHFLEQDAAAALDAADLLLFPSAWVELGDTRPEMLPALARTHRIAIVNANWSRGVVRKPGQGNSMIIAPTGELLASLPHVPVPVPVPDLPLAPPFARADATLELPRK